MFKIKEHELCERLGLGKRELARCRNELTTGEDWCKFPSGIMWSEQGVIRLGELIKAMLAAQAEAEAADTLLDEVPGLMRGSELQKGTGTVYRLWRNRRMLGVRLDGDGRQVDLRVRDNRKFFVGQEVPVHVYVDGCFRLGCRMPARRGKLAWRKRG